MELDAMQKPKSLAMFQLALPMYQLLLVLIIFFCTSFFAMLRMKGGASNTTLLPPSPPGLPIIGNLHQLGSLPHRSLQSISEKYGPLMLLRLGRVPTLVVSSAEAAREIMRTHDLVFASRPSLKVARVLFHESNDLAFAPYGEYWRQLRKICVTHLLSNKMVQSFSHMREEEVAIMINKISSQSEATNIIDMSEILYSFTNDVLCRAVSGKFSVEAGRNRVFREMIEEYNTLLADFHIQDYLPSLGWLDVFLGLTARAKKNRKRWDDILDGLISDRASRLGIDKRWDDILDGLISDRASRLGIDNRSEDGGFVDVLLSLQNDPNMEFTLTENDIKALLMDIFGAGTDTSYISLEWAMTELIRNPRSMKKLQAEVRKVAKGKTVIRNEDLSELSYLKAVLKEILRLHPPAPLLVPHESMEDCEIQGYKVLKQTRVIINFWAIGMDSRNWERPEEFLPERFINNPVDFKGNDFQFIPFGAGRRICPGINLAVATTELALANLIHKFEWELPSGMTIKDIDMTEAPGLATRKKQKLHLIARPCMC